MEGEQLQACVFVATAKSLPSRTWLASLFGSPKLSDADRLAILAGRAPKGALDPGPSSALASRWGARRCCARFAAFWQMKDRGRSSRELGLVDRYITEKPWAYGAMRIFNGLNAARKECGLPPIGKQ